MAILFEQTLKLFVFIITGFGLAKAKIIHGEHAKILSELFIYIFLPCNCLNAFSANFNVKYITEKYPLIIASAVIVMLLGIGMHFFAKLFSRKPYERSIYEYSLVLANFAGVGYSTALGLFGEAGLIDVMVFAIPLNIYTYTYGYSMLTKKSISTQKVFSVKTLLMLVNPVTMSMIVGMILGLTGISLPGFLDSALDSAAGCLGPVAMLIVGIAISSFDLKKLMTDVRSYIVAAMRLIVIPLGVGGILWILGIRGAVLTSALLLLGGPCGMNTVTLPRLYGENCEIGASLALISNIFVCVTLPMVLALFGIGV